MIDIDANRLKVDKTLGATQVIDNTEGNAVEKGITLTENTGVDVAIETIEIPASFDMCQAIVTAGDHITNIGVHGQPVQLNLDKPWDPASPSPLVWSTP